MNLMDEKTLLFHSLLEINRKYTKGGKIGKIWGEDVGWVKTLLSYSPMEINCKYTKGGGETGKF